MSPSARSSGQGREVSSRRSYPRTPHKGSSRVSVSVVRGQSLARVHGQSSSVMTLPSPNAMAKDKVLICKAALPRKAPETQVNFTFPADNRLLRLRQSIEKWSTRLLTNMLSKMAALRLRRGTLFGSDLQEIEIVIEKGRGRGRGRGRESSKTEVSI